MKYMRLRNTRQNNKNCTRREMLFKSKQRAVGALIKKHYQEHQLLRYPFLLMLNTEKIDRTHIMR